MFTVFKETVANSKPSNPVFSLPTLIVDSATDSSCQDAEALFAKIRAAIADDTPEIVERILYDAASMKLTTEDCNRLLLQSFSPSLLKQQPRQCALWDRARWLLVACGQVDTSDAPYLWLEPSLRGLAEMQCSVKFLQLFENPKCLLDALFTSGKKNNSATMIPAIVEVLSTHPTLTELDLSQLGRCGACWNAQEIERLFAAIPDAVKVRLLLLNLVTVNIPASFSLAAFCNLQKLVLV